MRTTWYISPDGNDAGPGTEAQPFATLARARDAIRALKAAGGLTEPLAVYLRGGEYPLAEPVVFTPEDSGTEACPISYCAYPGETPVLSGGRQLTGWRQGGGGLWELEIPEVKAGRWYFRDLWVNGERRERARLPEEGFYKVAAPAEPAEVREDEQGTFNAYSNYVEADVRRAAFHYEPGQMDPAWRNLDDIEIMVLQHWADSRMRIRTLDEEQHLAVFTERGFRPLDWSLGWYAENAFEGLTQPGRWYLDRQSGVLYYWPLPGEDPEAEEIVAPVAKTWLRLEGDWAAGRMVEHLAFRGLSFRYSAWDLKEGLGYSYQQGAVEGKPGSLLWAGYPAEGLTLPQSQVHVPAGVYAEGVRHVAWEDCEFAHTGAWALNLYAACRECRVVGNHCHDLGAGALRVGQAEYSVDPADETGWLAITDNLLQDGCRVYQGAPAIWMGQAGHNRLAHNEISGQFEWALSVGWQWGYWPPSRARDNVVEHNHCHHVGGGYFSPHATLYFLGPSPGTVVRYNLVEHIQRDGTGICLDNSASGILVENNLLRHLPNHGLLFNFNCVGNLIQNNLLAYCKGAQINRSGDAPWEGKLDQTGIFYRNLLYWVEGTPWFGQTWANYDMLTGYNLYWQVGGGEIGFLDMSFEEWQAKGLDVHSVLADPLFVDPEHGDFRLRPESPAFALGFRELDLSHVGPRPPLERD